MQQLYRRIPKNLRGVRHFCSYWYWEMSKQGYYVKKQVESDTILYGCTVSEKVWDISVQFSRAVVSDSWWAHGLQHIRLPCPSSTPGACSNSCPSSQWCHPTISSSVIPFSSWLQSFPVSHFFTSGGQSIGVSPSASVLPMNIPDCFPLGWTGWISLQSKGVSRVFSNTTVQKHQFFNAQLSLPC